MLVRDNPHEALDAAGLLPGVGIVPDLLNAGLYASEGDSINAGVSLSAAVPVVGQAVTGGRLGYKAAGV
ncbi:MAG: hypothetical protein SWN98_16850, partial [Pseudomonadota bacterium]|nr:hypothetical protein [Pseudomonadota bacterium]